MNWLMSKRGLLDGRPTPSSSDAQLRIQMMWDEDEAARIGRIGIEMGNMRRMHISRIAPRQWQFRRMLNTALDIGESTSIYIIQAYTGTIMLSSVLSTTSESRRPAGSRP